MIENNLLKILVDIFGERLKKNEIMAKHTTFKTGGPAEIFIEIQTKEELIELKKFCYKNNIRYFILGNGSNVLVLDEGIKGLVVSLKKMNTIKLLDDGLIYAEAGVSLGDLANFACDNGLTGLEFAHGIPGTVGGAIIMNAGAYEGDISQVYASGEFLTLSAEELDIDNADMKFAYRESTAGKNKLINLSAKFKLKPGDKAEIKSKMQDLWEQRSEKQPLEFPSSGSTFKRPPENFAGKLIMDAGLSGYKIGGAMVSEKHCGFIINYNNAKATDILNLILHVQTTVYDKFGVKLEREVKIIGT